MQKTPLAAPSRSPRQHGNTLIGLIVGLIIGLVIAVIVALVITKGSTPFTNKPGKTDKAPEPTAGQLADPNKPLYGNKEPAKEAARELASKAVPADPAAPAALPAAPVAAAAPAAAPAPAAAAERSAADKAAQERTAADKLAADRAKKAEPKDAAPKGDDDKYIYYLQAGAFREQGDAENSRAKLALLGFEASVSDKTGNTGTLYRVRIGPFNQAEAMNRVRAKLSENGVDVAVVRNQR